MTARTDDKVFNLSKGMVTMPPEMLVRMLWALIILGATATGAAAKFAWDANNQLRDMHEAIEQVGRTVEARTAERWTLTMMRRHDDEMRIHNPMIQVPDADDIHRRVMPK